MFAKRLDFLMCLTNTSNTTMSTALSFVPSYISKLRSGSRTLPKSTDFAQDAAQYLAKRITTAEQAEVLKNVLGGLNTLPENVDERAALLYNWLTSSAPDTESPVLRFINSFSMLSQNGFSDCSGGFSISPGESRSYYLGLDGKLEAIARILSAAAEIKTPRTLYIYSDEELDWLMDPDYIGIWTNMMFRALSAGHRIKVIRSMARTADEMFDALRAWLPIYSTGRMELFYAPQSPDSVFYHSFFVCPGTGGQAVVSTSASRDSKNSLYNYYTDQQAVDTLAANFEALLQKFRPLAQIGTPENPEVFWEMLTHIAYGERDIANCSHVLSAFTIPRVCFSLVGQRIQRAMPDVLTQFEELLAERLERFQVYDEVMLPSAQEVRERRVPLVFTDMLGVPNCFYTVEEYRLHLHRVIWLLENCENYHLFITESIDWPCDICVSTGIVLSKIAPPQMYFAQTEPLLTSATWSFLEMHRQEETPALRAEALAKLKALYDQL